MTLRTVHGITVPIQQDDVSPIIWKALVSGSYEAKEACYVTRAIKANDRVLELGAGIGIITALIARTPGVHVWAFEANPDIVELASRVMEANHLDNVTLQQGILTAGGPHILRFYVRQDFWMSSLNKEQGPFEDEITITSGNVDSFIERHNINVLVMDIKSAEYDLLQGAVLNGVERIFLELHDHLYGLAGIRDITQALTSKGYAYDPRGSHGPCVLFSKDNTPREYQEESFYAS